MFWRTECIAYEPTCGGERRRSEPEASPEANRQARSDWRASTVEPVGKAAVATRAAEASSGQVGGGTRRWPGATPKTRAVGERGAGDRNKTLSRSCPRSEEHTSELQSRQYLHSFPTRRSSDLSWRRHQALAGGDAKNAGSGGARCR